jgi:CheY-like chemotaxis protein
MQLKEAAILIVEDEPVLREIIGAWFERIAAKVVTAGNGAQALEALAANPVDLVISDIRMPVMDGIALLKELRARGKKPPVILLSGFSDIDTRQAYDLGTYAFLSKPMERQDLLDAVRRSLMPREELWHTPFKEEPLTVLELNYPSLAAALQQNIAFGSNGFCIAEPQQMAEGPIRIRLGFQREEKVLEGEGVIRWNSPSERQFGVELFYVAPNSRKWLAALIDEANSVAFIPASLNSRKDFYAQTA